MAWVRLDEEFPDHPKVVTAGPLAGWLHVCALAYCNRHLTDGFIPRAQVARLVNFDGVLELGTEDDTGPCDVRDWPDISPYKLADRLVAVGMWEERQGGYLIHDYLDYQPSRAESQAQRKVKSDAGRAGGLRSGESRRSRTEAKSKQNGTRSEADDELNGKQKGSTSPSRPEADHEANGQAKTKPVSGTGSRSISAVNHHVGLAIVGNGEMDQPQAPTPPRQPPDPIVERLLTAWPEARRRKLAGAALAVVAEARRWLDAALIDEVVGHMLAMDPPPGTPRYLLTVAPDWAQQRGANLSTEALASMAAAAKGPERQAAS